MHTAVALFQVHFSSCIYLVALFQSQCQLLQAHMCFSSLSRPMQLFYSEVTHDMVHVGGTINRHIQTCTFILHHRERWVFQYVAHALIEDGYDLRDFETEKGMSFPLHLTIFQVKKISFSPPSNLLVWSLVYFLVIRS